MGGSGSFAGPFGKMLRQPLALLSLESVLCSTTLPTVLERGDASFVGISDPPLITSASTIGGAPSSVSPFELGRRIAAPRDMTNLRPGACGENAKTAAAGIIKRRNTSTMENRIIELRRKSAATLAAPKVNLVLSRVFQDTDFFKKRKKSVVVVVVGGEFGLLLFIRRTGAFLPLVISWSFVFIEYQLSLLTHLARPHQQWTRKLPPGSS